MKTIRDFIGLKVALTILLCMGGISTVSGTTYGADCIIEASSGNTSHPIEGTLQFIQVEEGETTIYVSLSGFVSGDDYSQHGFHIHDQGDLSNGCKGASGHYNPAGVDHAGPEDAIRHVGDLGNIIEDGDGKVVKMIEDDQVMLSGVTTVIGRTVVIHEKPDDLGRGGAADSKTTGAAGSRLACCIINARDPDELDLPDTSSAQNTTFSMGLIVFLALNIMF